MIIDCFTFFRELDLLEIRLNELSPYVDKFLIVESRQTFQGDPKPLYFYENLDRFAKFRGRIIHVVVDLPPGNQYEHGWQRENASRDAIAQGLQDLPGDTIILLSDLDEIPNLIGWDSNREIPACWSHQLYYYYVDLEVCRIKGTVAVPLTTFFKHPDIQGLGSKLREWRHYNPKFVIEGTRGGWHFSYLGGVEAIQAKIKAFAHAELNPHANPASIRRALEDGWKDGIDLFNRNIYSFTKVEDGDLPSYLLKNRKRFEHFWMPDKLPLQRASEELPPQKTPMEEIREIISEEKLDMDPVEVDSGPLVLRMVHDTLSDMVQEGLFDCERSEELGASEQAGAGPSGSEATVASSSSPSEPGMDPIPAKIDRAQTTLKLDPDQNAAKILSEPAPSNQMIYVEPDPDEPAKE